AHLAELFFALAILFRHDLRPRDRLEVGVDLVGDGLGDQGFPRSGRPVEQHTLGRVDPELLEEFGVAHRQLDHFTDLFEFAVQPANIFVSHRGRGALVAGRLRDDLLGGFLADFDLGRFGHDNRAVWRRVGDFEWDPLARSPRKRPEAERERTGLSLCDRLPRGLILDVRPDVSPDPKVLWQRHRDRLGGIDLGLLDGNVVVDPDLGFAAELAVDPDHALSLVVGIARPDPRDRATFLSVDHDVIAVFEV